MPSTPIRSFKELQEAIAGLPAPGGGMVRVFRGQGQDYRAIPSSFGRVQQTRGSAAAVETFLQHLFVKSALLTVLGELLQLPKLTKVDLRVSASDFFLAEALVQHYGYQSRYVDVTTALEVAAWFSRHCFVADAQATLPDTTPPQCIFPAWYESLSGSSVVYVLDVKPWDGQSQVQDGDYIDLIPLAPDGVNRPSRQRGGVLYIPASEHAVGDAYRWVVATFEVDFDWSDVGADWSTDYLFPKPETDPVYERLLRAPYFQGIRFGRDGKAETVQRRTFLIPEYCQGAGDDTGRQAYRAYDVQLRPTLFHPWLLRNVDHLLVNPLWQEMFRPAFENATPVMLTRPSILFSMTRGGPAKPPTEPPYVPPLLRNFFLEFAPDAFSLAYDESTMARGFWCFWFSPTNFMLQSFGTQDGKPIAKTPLEFEWKAGSGLEQTGGPDVMKTSFVTRPLDFIRMVGGGEMQLLPPGRLGHGYHELTTTEKFWADLPNWTDLM